METGLALITPNDWQALQQQAKALVESGFLPNAVNTPQKAVAIMMLGRELGIAPWASLSSINVIQGKPTVSPQLMLALINRSGQLENMEVITHEDDSISVMMKRKGRSEHFETFGRSDAEKMGLWGKDNWRKQPLTMMKWRAVAAAARVVFADVILGLYTPEEMGADVVADEQGNMTVVEVSKPPMTPQPQLPSTIVDEGEIVEEQPPAPLAVVPKAEPSGSSATSPASHAASGNPLPTVTVAADVSDAIDEAFGKREANTITVSQVRVGKTDKGGRVLTFEQGGVKVLSFTREPLRDVLAGDVLEQLAVVGVYEIPSVRLTYSLDGKFLKLDKAELVA